MLAEPKCWSRNCTHFIGVRQPDGTEETEVNVCKAFPDGIPNEITYGTNPHVDIFDGQKGIYIFEKGEERKG